MCGISGFVGKSKKPALSFQLITKLFEKLESRGIDAAGFWGVQTGGETAYHKEPGRSSLFVKKDVWRKIAKFNPNLLLTHARAASKGVGEPECNKNNHPFVNVDKSLALVHNGRIEDYEYKALKLKYEVHSECDSEILLRIFENSKMRPWEHEYADRLGGISDIFSFVSEGHMAVAIGERCKGKNLLWLFRNCHRPLWVVDVRDVLGQIFFVSEPRIWEDAVCESGCRYISRTQKLIELPTEEIWFFIADDENIPVLQRYEVEKSEDPKPWLYEKKRRPEDYFSDEVGVLEKKIHRLTTSVMSKLRGAEDSILASEYHEAVERLKKIEQYLIEFDESLSDIQ